MIETLFVIVLSMLIIVLILPTVVTLIILYDEIHNMIYRKFGRKDPFIELFEKHHEELIKEAERRENEK